MRYHTWNATVNSTIQSESDKRPDGEFEHAPEYIFVYMTVINVLIFGVGLFGNMMVILVVCRVREMRNPTNYFLFTLSIADLCVLLVCQPVAMMEFYAKERWYLGGIMCELKIFFSCLCEKQP